MFKLKNNSQIDYKEISCRQNGNDVQILAGNIIVAWFDSGDDTLSVTTSGLETAGLKLDQV
jgi:hypothetical protein